MSYLGVCNIYFNTPYIQNFKDFKWCEILLILEYHLQIALQIEIGRK